jgi:hypothetical protein
MEQNQGQASRRGFIKKATYVAPAILTLAAMPEFAKAGSFKPPIVGPYVPPVFSNPQTLAIYSWLIADPQRISRLADAARALKSLQTNDAIQQLVPKITQECQAGLASMTGWQAALIRQALLNSNLTELAKTILAMA